MADEIPSLQIDNDWKKQAQEEKRRLAEQQKQREQTSPAAPVAPTSPQAAAGRDPRGGAQGRELPPASFASVVQSMLTQTLFYLGDLAMRGSEPVINLDMAKHHIDSLAVLEDKTQNNLTPEEKSLLDSALYEGRMRYVNVASQYIS